MRVGVIGVGIMGGAMAANLVTAGHEVTGFDIDPKRRNALNDVGGRALPGVYEVAEASEVVILSLPSAEALRAVAADLASDRLSGLVGLDTGTLPLEVKFEARDVLAGFGIELMDTPLSGTGIQATDATLVVLASGSEDGYARAKPVFDAIGRSTHFLGEFGNGSRMKYIANLLVAIHSLAAAEAHTVGLAAGMNPATVQRVMEDGVGSSKIFEIRGPMMVADDYTPAARLDLLLKDARLIDEFARDVGATTPLLGRALDVYREASESGLGDLDVAALCRHLERLSGIVRNPRRYDEPGH